MNSCACARRAALSISACVAPGPAVADVGGDRAMQERRVLRDHADRGAQALLRHVADVLAVDADAALLELVEAQEQVDERGLARARASDEADALARPHDEVEVVEHLAAVAAAVGERDVLEADLAARHDELARVRARRRASCGTAIVSMPSCTTPMFSKMPVTSQLTQPATLAICQASGNAVATTPGARRGRGPTA